MKKGWTTKKLMAVMAIVVIEFLVWLLIGSPLFWASGSIFGSFSFFITNPFFVTLTVLFANQFGAASLFMFLAFFVNLPLPTIFPKVVNLLFVLIAGLPIDYIGRFLIKRRRLFGFAAGAFDGLINCAVGIVLYFTVGLPGTENVPDFLTKPVGYIPATLLLAGISGLAGLGAVVVYEKLSTTAVVKRIQK